MPTAKKKASNKRFNSSLLSKNTKRLTLVVVIIAIGLLIVYARAASPRTIEEFRTSGSLHMSYFKEKPTVATQNSSGVTTYASRARSIEVSVTGELFCIPEDNGQITKRQLTTGEQAQLDAQVQLAKQQVAPSKSSSQVQVQVNNQEGLFIRDRLNAASSDVYAPAAGSEYFNNTVAILEGQCTVAATPIKEEQVPKWQEIEGADKGSRKSANNITERLMAAVLPKVEALASSPPEAPPQPPSPDYSGVNIDHENRLNELYINERASRGIGATVRVSCLDQAARIWAENMARSDLLRHTSPLTLHMEPLCTRSDGQSWTKLGENVGYSGISVQNGQAGSIESANIVHQAYMNSPGHQANQLDPDWMFHGIGSYTMPNGTKVYTAHQFWRGAIKK